MATKRTTTKTKPPEFAGQALDALERGLGRQAETVERVGKAIAERMPELPATPLATRIPSGEQVVLSTFAVAGRLLEIQRDYALKIVGALTPLRQKVVREPVEVRATTKATAKTA